MASRKRTPRIIGSRRQRRSLPPLLETLENRVVLTSPSLLPTNGGLYTLASGSTVRIMEPGTGAGAVNPSTDRPTLPTSGVILDHAPVANAGSGSGPAQALPTDVGFYPSQIISAYGINDISFDGIKDYGKGQTIGIYEEGSNPDFVDTSNPNYDTSALAIFDKTFGIPDPPSLTFYDGNGNPITPSNPGPGDEGAGVEIALDIEWLHAIAPYASIDVVNGVADPATYYSDIPQGMATLASLPHVSVVSVSYGWFLEYYGQGALEQEYDALYIQPALAANPNVTFLAASGDDGAFASDSLIYPSVSPEVVAVGGTTLTLNTQNQWENETGWSGSGGGYSTTFPEPSFQQNDGFDNQGKRTVPDVAADADPASGVAVYDPYDFGAGTPWAEVGGTSLATPLWAGMIAIADQGRVLNGGTDLGSTQALGFLYSLSSADFHDITVGNNGLYNAGPGYDLLTGRGSPKANLLIPALAASGLASQAVIAIEPPTSVIAGGKFGTVINAETSDGTIDPGFSGTATLSLVSGPSGATFTKVTIPFSGGQAIFDGLSLSELSSGTDYQFEVTVTNLPTAPLQLNPIDVATAATPGVGVYYPLPLDVSLRHDVTVAGSDNANPIDDLYMVYSQAYVLDDGELLLQNTSTFASKTINILSQDQFAATAPTINANGTSRVFEIVGTNGTTTNLAVTFQGGSQGLVIEGGLATDDGGLTIPSATAVGGGLLIDGGKVTLTNVTVQKNDAVGAVGTVGSSGGFGRSAGSGGPGKPGYNSQGGAIYVASGALTLDDDTIDGNVARGGVGGAGGTGQNAATITIYGLYIELYRAPGGPGGTGAVGGNGLGGALFVAGGSVSVTSGAMVGNSALGGNGGQGGLGGHGGIVPFAGGQGGIGGVGGKGLGGGIYLRGGTLTLNSPAIDGNVAAGGAGGAGGRGGTGGYSLFGPSVGPGGAGGLGGNGGNGAGGGIYVIGGSIPTFNGSSINDNAAAGGAGGAGGTVGVGGGNPAGKPGVAGTGTGGGIYDQVNLSITGGTIDANTANNGAGIAMHGNLTLTSVDVSGNTATLAGGGIDITGIVYVNQSTLSDDSAALGGAIDSTGTLNVAGGQFDDDSATQSGGGIYSSGKAAITGGTSFDNDSATLGGAIYSAKNGGVSVTGAILEDNSAVQGGAIYSVTSLQVASSDLSYNFTPAATNAYGGAILNSGGNATLTDDTFDGNSATNGGAIDSVQGNLTITGGSFTDNSATGLGGAIDTSGTATASGVSFESNSATGGSGGAIFNKGSLAITNGSVITGNKAKIGGGIASNGKLLLANTSFSDNSAQGGSSAFGGALYNSGGTVSISGGSLTGNSATGAGGGIFISQGALTITANTVLASNSAGAGGAIDNVAGTVSLTNVTLDDNSAQGNGGAILNFNVLKLNIASFQGNTAADGGSLFNDGSGTIVDVTMSGDSATEEGGGVFNEGVLQLTNSTVADESALDGGGVFNLAGTLTTLNVTIAENNVISGGSGGGLNVGAGTVILYNTIVAANTNGTGPDAPADDIAGSVSTLLSAYNLIGPGGSGNLMGGSNGNLVLEKGAWTGLATGLANNGGPTETIALVAPPAPLPSDTPNPAIDAGGNTISGVTVPTSDERGALRGNAGGLNAGTVVDIGAYEASSSYLVTTTVDSSAYGTLRSAVGWANLSVNFNEANILNPAPNTVVFDTANVFATAQTITLTGGTLEFSDTTTPEAIAGDGVSKLTISGGGAITPITVDQNVTVGLSAFTISGGYSATSGGAISSDGILTLTGMTITGNQASDGGAVWNQGDGLLTVVNSTISKNSATIEGGGIASLGSLSVGGSVFSTNTASSGGAIFGFGPLQIAGSTFSGNSAGFGGAIENDNTTSTVIADSTITGNSAPSGGYGGGIWNNSLGTLVLQATTVSNNSAEFGGGIYNDTDDTVSLVDCTVSGNTAFIGGGIDNALGTVTATSSTLSGNSATPGGLGGAIWSDGTLSLTNATIANNSALIGGGIDNSDTGTLTAMNVTIAYNTVATGGAGGGLNIDAGTTTYLFNTIVALNTIGSTSPPTYSDIGGAGTVDPSSVNNLIGTGGSDSLSGGNLVGITMPGLASGLANNGGPTQTIALLSGSPAIDAGANTITGQMVPTVDQRGALRGNAGGLNAGTIVDIGAYEASSSYLVSSLVDSPDSGSLRAAIGWANVSTNANPEQLINPQPNTIDFSTAVAQGTITLSQGPLALTNTTMGVTIDGGGVTISGGGVSGVFTVASGVATAMSDLTITDGNAAKNGGGIDNSGILTLSDVYFTANSATNGGAIANEPGATLSITDSSIGGQNTASQSGGGLYNSGVATLLNDTITNNLAAAGGGIANVQSSVLIPSGGTFIPAPAKLTIIDTTIADNSATGGNGGGIDNTGTVTISTSTIDTNTASGLGGGIGNEVGGVFTATNVTLSNNQAASGGGIGNSGTATFVSATIAYNSATVAGGGVYVAAGTTSLYDTIIASNTLGTGSSAPASDIYVLSSGGGKIGPNSSYNLIGPGGSGGLASGVNGNLILAKGAWTGLATGLANNGGPTETIALVAPPAPLPSDTPNPAIDAGNASIPGANVPITDQRGALRGPAGLDAGANPDIGAFEASSSYLVTTTSVRPDVGTIVTAVGWANISPINVNPEYANDPVPNTIVFDSSAGATFATPQTITLTSGPLEFKANSVPMAISGAGTNGLVISGGGQVGVFLVDSGATVDISGLTIADGSVSNNGGGIDNFGNLSIDDATFTGNTATNGGAITDEAGGTLAVLNSTFSANNATQGGAIWVSSGPSQPGMATITDSTFSGNSAATGGAIASAGTLTIVSSTIANNTATSAGGGGGINVGGGTTTLYNTIVALNTDSGTPATPDDIAGTVSPSSSNNLIDDTATRGGLTIGANGNIIGMPAGLSTSGLANNGGPTETIALVAGSLALNTGAAMIPDVTVPGFDQRGVLRNPDQINNGTTIDIGAYEASAVYLVTSAADSMTTGTLRSAIDWANVTPISALSGPLTIEFNLPAGSTITLSQALGTLDLTSTTAAILIGPGASDLTISGGGAVELFSIASGVDATFTGLTFSAGQAASGGAFLNSGDLVLTNDTLSGNGAVYYGGAIYNLGGTLDIANSTFTGNVAPYGLGGAIDNTGTATITNSSFTGGAAYQGGAIDNKSGTLSVANSTLDNNSGTLGGAIFNNAMATITSSTIANDNTSFDGGGIANDLGGTMTIVNSTIAFNHSGQTGGGINQVGGGNGESGSLTVINSTIAYNSVDAGGAGGGIDASSGTTNVYNTIVALNTAGTGTSATANDISGIVSLLSGYNLIGRGGAGGLTNGSNGNQVGVINPGLASALANNGGPTQTIALLAGSTAIDAGSNALAVDANGNPLLYDQRGPGYPRIVNGIVDIGAYERALATTTTLKSSVNPSVIGQSVTFTATVTPAKASTTVPTGTVTFYVGTVAVQMVTLFGGTASYTTSALPLGASTITAVYSGDLTYADSTSAALTQTVNQVSTPGTPIASTSPASGALAASSSGITTLAGAVASGHHGKVVKKGAASKKALPHGGSATKFHQSKQTATVKRSVSLVAKHATAQPKKK